MAAFCRKGEEELNPYDSKQSTTHLLDRVATPTAPTIHVIAAVMIAGTLLTGVLILLQWFVLDYVAVRVLRYPEELGKYDWAFVGSPVLPLLLLVLLRSISPRLWKLQHIVVMTILGWILAVVLIATIGIGFHFWIGGTL